VRRHQIIPPPAPFPFTPAEEAFAALRRRSEPPTCHFEVRTPTDLDPERLCDAVRTAVAVHPMTRVAKRSGRRLLRPAMWAQDGSSRADVVEVVRSHAEETVSRIRGAFLSRNIEVRHAPAFRLLLLKGAGGDTLIVSIHHAITDGVGMSRLMRSIACAYAGRSDPTLGVDPLAARSRLRRPGLDGAHESPPRAGDHVAPEGASGVPGYGVVGASLPLDEVVRPPVTVNDAMVAALHRAIARWNAAHGCPADVLSVLVPVNLRPAEWRGELVANLGAAGHIWTDRQRRRTDDALIAAVAQQSRAIKDTAGSPVWPAWRLMLGLGLLRIPGFRVVRGVTAVLSNLGKLLHQPDFGDGPALEVWFSPPVWMPTGVGVGLVGQDDRLFVTIRYCRGLFSASAAERFLAEYMAAARALHCSSAPPVRDRVG
jgi:NRPS condensation-like uncharacterized protein